MAAGWRRGTPFDESAGVNKALPLTALVFVAVVGITASAPARTKAPVDRRVISIVGTNDLHGYIAALPLLGGYLANLRAARAADGGGVLLLDAGDMFQGTLESNPVEGASVVRGYNALGYQAAAVGNHEFDFGPEGTGVPAPGANLRGALFARAREAHFPLLAANVVDGATGKPLAAPNLRPSALIEVAGTRIGVVGVTTSETPRTTRPRFFAGLSVEPLAATIEREARALRASGATVVIAVAHSGAECARFDNPDDLTSCKGSDEIFEVARALTPGLVDAIVAGHTHALVAHRVGGIPIIEARDHGRALGRIDLVIDRVTGHVVEHRLYPPRFLCATRDAEPPCPALPYEGAPVAEDRHVAAAIAPDLERAARRGAEPVGVTLAGPIARGQGETALGNLFTDLMREARPQADLALTHSGGLRADLPAGALLYRGLFETEPSDNTLAFVRLTGRQLADILSENLRQTFTGLLSLSGVRAAARCDGGALRVALTRANGRRIADDESLLVVTNSFLATGGTKVLRPETATGIETDPPVRDVVAEVLRRKGGRLEPRALLDPAAPRFAYPGPLPVRCPTVP